MLTTILAYLLVGLFSAGEGRLRRGQQAQAREAEAADRRSTRAVSSAYAFAILCLLVAPFLDDLAVGRISARWAGWLGLAVIVCGIALRIWANLTLGQFYTRTLRVLDDHHVVERGPYRLIRHPGYLGTMVMWAGAGLAATNWLILPFMLLAMSIAYRYRIEAEEDMLVQHLGQEYVGYQRHTWKLIPFVY
jgi:protein-S-isoprenylcysteine O-methyltransferase Ste14